jgi:hypothetical protein
LDDFENLMKSRDQRAKHMLDTVENLLQQARDKAGETS